jgi:plastocyanin
MPSKDEGNNKAVLATLVLMLLSLSLASSIAISVPYYASAQEVTGQAGGNATNATMAGAAGNATNATMAGAAGNATTTVTQGPGSSTKTTDAFSPNPVQVSVGSTVTWTNNDSVIHTVVSGTSPTPSGLFESPIMNPGDTFEYTFTEAGEVPYFCTLHPNMLGTVSVS